MERDDSGGEESGPVEATGLPVLPRRDPSEVVGVVSRERKARVLEALFDEPAPAVKVGRFSIVRKLGSGGMGVVYMAYDEQLDRRVAVKLLRTAGTDTTGRARMQREAQAMARLSHPHVVTVYEVDAHEGQLFVAMEYVEGQDLRAWLEAAERGWGEVLAVFRQAGQGLAAAHDAGLAHRDFKPDNVLVGRDGRARVADFGLAHALEGEAGGAQPSAPADASSSALELALTRTGALVGTPAYMAPEQYAGQRGDARSDQFAFCVALWEGLAGQRPFSGRSLAELSEAIVGGELEAVPERAREQVPEWVFAALRRGLAVDPGARWPSMAALLEVLANDPQARRRRRWSWAVGVVLVAFVLAATTWVAAAQIHAKLRARYWSGLTEELLAMERERGLRQLSDDGARARDAARMSVARRYRPGRGVVEHVDATVTALLLREVETEARDGAAWISAANEVLGEPVSEVILRGHEAVVTAMVFDAAGRWLYSADAKGAVWRWSVDTGEGRALYQHGAEVSSLALSPAGSELASGSVDGELRLWTERTGPSTLERYGGAVRQLSFSADARRLLTAAKDGLARVHALDGGATRTFTGHAGPVYAASFDASEARVLTTSLDRSARVWRADTGALEGELRGHEQGVFFGAFVGEDSTAILTAADDGQVRRWSIDDLGAGSAGTVIASHPRAITAFAVDGARVITGSVDGQVRVTDWQAGAEASEVVVDHGDDVRFVGRGPAGVVSVGMDARAFVSKPAPAPPPRALEGHRQVLLTGAMDGSGRRLATGSWSGQIRVWALDQAPLVTSLEGHGQRVFDVRADSQGTRFVTASFGGRARIWRAADGAALETLDGGNAVLNAAVFSPSGDSVATAGKGPVLLWRLEPGRDARAQVLLDEGGQVWDLAFDDGGERLAAAASDARVRVWTLTRDGPELQVLEGHAGRVVSVAFEPGGERLASAGADGTVRVWSPGDGDGDPRGVHVLPQRDPLAMDTLRWSPDGRWLAAAAAGGGAWVWSSAAFELPRALRSDETGSSALAFDAAGERLAVGSRDGRVRVWSVAEGTLLTTLEGHTGPVVGAAFLPGGRLISASLDRTLRLWRLDDGASVVLSGHSVEVLDLAVAGGARALSVAKDGSVSLWDVDRVEWEPQALMDALGRRTWACLAPRTRTLELGEAETEARLAHARCEGRAQARAGL
ncbi:serine/threonine protein kinase with WD40 repeats [Plesiocystis pacifica SIR-1]|uniref:Serine/threonine protein kinase with WD40 repeats n=1 Tax=Plesiocystis pacifica SIR-1 TaxID=391625 RepID=A6GAS4_9BACT|nr:serine/threonine-protein kinase [Plesiocystis pacifica]EDM77015.1 serine/threonine protein kinase with WD40 repeats [Plesiocystis pacifica SIR-1]